MSEKNEVSNLWVWREQRPRIARMEALKTLGEERKHKGILSDCLDELCHLPSHFWNLSVWYRVRAINTCPSECKCSLS